MSELVLLDSGPLGALCSPRRNTEIVEWYALGNRLGVTFVVSQAADFEVRRELIRTGFDLSVARLERLIAGLRFVPVSRDMWLTAARLWAESRNRGRPTADPRELDIDVLLAATALSLQAEGDVVIATTNVGHLAQFVDARDWRDISFA